MVTNHNQCCVLVKFFNKIPKNIIYVLNLIYKASCVGIAL